MITHQMYIIAIQLFTKFILYVLSFELVIKKKSWNKHPPQNENFYVYCRVCVFRNQINFYNIRGDNLQKYLENSLWFYLYIYIFLKIPSTKGEYVLCTQQFEKET